MESLATKVDCAETILARKTEINRAAKGEAAARPKDISAPESPASEETIFETRGPEQITSGQGRLQFSRNGNRHAVGPNEDEGAAGHSSTARGSS